ncbi:hypothetical protein CES85_1097 [Ochrobactrum quorumnocens]|uniref:Uncharacterized protein n=1 Tax=Ochrobactrum quorumnocens TaxID=271865 RepID=A0A248UF91_9HYPH|nr:MULTISPECIES: hypothetical protein [Brucella]ASV85081.1 hypothetical protein CES85_1097 [[Ochrobactrum] quorumnocens]MCV9907190.1 hypothetical protein [Brucella sp. HL-2]
MRKTGSCLGLNVLKEGTKFIQELNVHSFGKVAIASAIAILMVSPALADAKTDSLQLRKSVVEGLFTYIELGENSDGRSKALGIAMEEKVQVPVAKAQYEWQEIAKNSSDAGAYEAYKMCDTAASSLQNIVKIIAGYIKSDSTQEPEYDSALTKLGADLTECEKALDVQLTF